MTGRCSPALLHLRDQVDARWPRRDRSSDGCCGDAAHAARHSDHNPVGGYAHAFDIDENLAPGLGAAPLMFLAPLLLADARAKYVIYERHIYYARCRVHDFVRGCFAAGGHPYSGANAHEHHLHLSIQPDATLDTRDWRITAAQPKEGDLTDTQAQLLAQAAKDAADAKRAAAEANNRASNLERWIPRIAEKLGVTFAELDRH